MAKYDAWVTPAGLDRIETFCSRGLNDEELAAAMSITDRTLRDWKERFSGISAAITRGRGGADEQIENALFERARGGVRTVMKPIKRRIREFDKNTGKCCREEEVIEDREEEIYIPPDTNAIKFYLTNRAPDRWSNKVEVEGSGTVRLEDILE